MNGWGLWGVLRRLPALLRDAAAFIFLPAIVLVVAVDVVARYFLNLPLQWSQEVASLALLLVFVAAIPYANATHGHIRTETLYERYGPRMQALVDLLSAVCGGVLMGVIAWWQLRELPGLIQRDEGAEYIDIPYWPISLFLALCMLFGVVQVAAQAWRCARKALHPVGDTA